MAPPASGMSGGPVHYDRLKSGLADRESFKSDRDRDNRESYKPDRDRERDSFRPRDDRDKPDRDSFISPGDTSYNPRYKGSWERPSRLDDHERRADERDRDYDRRSDERERDRERRPVDESRDRHSDDRDRRLGDDRDRRADDRDRRSLDEHDRIRGVGVLPSCRPQHLYLSSPLSL